MVSTLVSGLVGLDKRVVERWDMWVRVPAEAIGIGGGAMKLGVQVLCGHFPASFDGWVEA